MVSLLRSKVDVINLQWLTIVGPREDYTQMNALRNFLAERRLSTPLPAKNTSPVTSTEQPHLVNDSIEALIELRNRHNQRASPHQLTVERLINVLGRPFFLYSFLALAILWIAANSIPYLFGRQPFDEPPFFWLQGMVSFLSLVITTMVLIAQNRLTKITERQAQLDVHINLLSERKLAKLIALVEELRQDLPIVRNRLDTEAEAMAQAADPIAVLTALEEAIHEEASTIVSRSNQQNVSLE